MSDESASPLHPLCEALQATIAEDLPSIQAGFDAYQQACFVARPPEFFALELTGEAGELANLVKKQWKGASVDQLRLAEEAADVFIALMNYCNSQGLDLSTAVVNKLTRIEPSR
jgi:NTP pyrophosphatase (non-canonical NTP hydrolase)